MKARGVGKPTTIVINGDKRNESAESTTERKVYYFGRQPNLGSSTILRQSDISESKRSIQPTKKITPVS